MIPLLVFSALLSAGSIPSSADHAPYPDPTLLDAASDQAPYPETALPGPRSDQAPYPDPALRDDPADQGTDTAAAVAGKLKARTVGKTPKSAKGQDSAKVRLKPKPKTIAGAKGQDSAIVKGGSHAKEKAKETAEGKGSVPKGENAKVPADSNGHAIPSAQKKADVKATEIEKPHESAKGHGVAKGNENAGGRDSVKVREEAEDRKGAVAHEVAKDIRADKDAHGGKSPETHVSSETHEIHEQHEAQEVHDSHDTRETHDVHRGGNQDEATIPQMAPKPDSAFARAADWNKGLAEVLSYSVLRRGRAGETRFSGRLVTERMYLRKDGIADRKPSGKGDVEILNTVLAASGEEGGIPFATETVIKLPRADRLKLLRQDQSLQSLPGTAYRSLDCSVSPPRLRTFSSGGESPRDSVLTRWPVYTEEMLFTYLRAVPLHPGYKEEVWLQDWAGEGRFNPMPQYAAISVRSKTSSVRDLETWYITVDRDDGRRSEFWISAAGLHPVVLAILGDGATWTLQDIARKNYWSW